MTEWGPEWRTTCTRAVLKKRADENHPRPRYIVQDLTARFEMSILIAPVAHPELNPIEMIWGTVKMAWKRANLTLSLATLRGLAEAEFEKITAEVWDCYEAHTIEAESYYRAVDEVCTDLYRPPLMATATTTRSRGVIWVRRVTRKRMPCLSRRVDQSLESECGSDGRVSRLVWTGACAG